MTAVASAPAGPSEPVGSAAAVGTPSTVAGSVREPATADPPRESAAPAEIAVSVTGRVRRPGIVLLPEGSRVADAIEAAGGLLDPADMTGINLAEPLTDGRSVVVVAGGAQITGPPPGTAPGGSGTGAADPSAPGAPLDLNTADVAALDALPGVGPVTAENIVAWRDLNGSFASVEQLQEVTGIGPAKYEQIAPLVRVG
ncbi:ComEA family DNA-binding protein [Nakamurella sp. YIM 132087]|uniref:ComEA family DNA-binding protein n=2 Tax=Nakamurella alba TaxID=2665158 RepID=A0A7K1FGA2_9ACTN|nr:ComEA family DNA-binding protein [Nakamurella alba]